MDKAFDLHVGNPVFEYEEQISGKDKSETTNSYFGGLWKFDIRVVKKMCTLHDIKIFLSYYEFESPYQW